MSKRLQKPSRWKVGEPRKSFSSGELMFRINGPEIVFDYEDWGFTEKSAKLIAAAPDLLAAAQAMLACCYDLERDDETIAAVKAARAAIAKATGAKP